ncbi:MAG: sodium:calcium antiporter [Actinobacteria bacterium]|nr:sodium:calcium antiporter [Actinomycetota bacterium]MBT4655647.1 sodium:calcium antiporter [Actinomycetota bacterium]
MWGSVILLVVGLVVLALAADQFVLGASRLAHQMNVPTVVMGALILGFGTSAPEFVVSTWAARQGEVNLGLGNIVGSNVANLTLVLGVAAFIRPIAVPAGTLRRGFLSLGGVLIFAALAQNDVTTGQGLVLLAVFVMSMVLMVRLRTGEETPLPIIPESKRSLSPWLRAGAGLLGTMATAQVVVGASTDLIETLNLSGGFVGFSMVALGTSLPELVTVGAAARRNETGLILGNLLGSNLFNSLAVGAGLFLAGPGTLSDVFMQTRGVLAMVAVAALALLLMATGRMVGRREGAILLVAYFGVLAYLGFNAAVA